MWGTKLYNISTDSFIKKAIFWWMTGNKWSGIFITYVNKLEWTERLLGLLLAQPLAEARLLTYCFISGPMSFLTGRGEENRVGARGINLHTSCFILKHLTKALKICQKYYTSPKLYASGCQMFIHLWKCFSHSAPTWLGIGPGRLAPSANQRMLQ